MNPTQCYMGYEPFTLLINPNITKQSQQEKQTGNQVFFKQPGARAGIPAFQKAGGV